MAAQTIEIDTVLNYRDNTAGINNSQSRIDRFTESVERTQREMDRLSGKNARPTVSLVDRASSALTRLTGGLRSFAGRTWRATVRITDYATRPLRGIKNMLFSVKSLVMAVGAGIAVKKGIMDPVNLADAYSSAKIGFSTLLGDKRGQKMMDDLDAFARKTPFKTSNTIEQAQKLVAMGWETKNIVRDMYTIGDAAAATGKGDEGLQRISLALSQIKSKGKLSTEELNQLAEAGISAKRYIAEGLGYGSGDKGLMKMAKDLEGGKIGSEAAIKAILKGMKEYKGMMDKTANETVKGLKSQIEDTFEINIFRKWGQGLQDGAKRGLGSLVNLLDSSEDSLQNLGNQLYKIGKELSNLAADKLENTIDKLMKLTQTREFKEASLFGKFKLVWDDIIAKPFGKWWDSKGKPYIDKKMEDAGRWLGSAITRGFGSAGSIILNLLGVDTKGMGFADDAKDVGGAFSKGFIQGFDADKVVSTIKKVWMEGFKSLFSGNTLSNIILTGLTVKLTGGLLKSISVARNIWLGMGGTAGASGIGYAGGLKGLIGGASTADGSLVGTGLVGNLAKFGSLLGSGAQTGGGLAAVGGLSAAGGIVGGIGVYKGVKDLVKAVKADNSSDRQHYGWRAGTKLGMVGAGAGAGAAIGSVVPVLGTAAGALIGAGVGGLGAIFAGDKVGDRLSGVKKSTKELREEAEKLKKVNMARHFGDIELSASELQRKVRNIIGVDTTRKINKFTAAMQTLDSIDFDVSGLKNDISYTHERIMGKEKLSADDIEEYKASLTEYAEAVKSLVNADRQSTRSAFALLYGDDTKGLQLATKGINKTYTGIEKDIAKKSKKLNDVIAKAFEDGKVTIDEEKKINELASKIMSIQNRVQQRVEAAERKASYGLIEKKFSYERLTPESYKNLTAALDEQTKADSEAYDNAYMKAQAALNMQYESGDISKKKYNKRSEKLEKKWLKGKSKSARNKSEVLMNVLNNNYSGEFEKIDGLLTDKSGLTDRLKKYTTVTSGDGSLSYTTWNSRSAESMEEFKNSMLNRAGITEEVQAQMADLYKTMRPQKKELKKLEKEYKAAGESVPQWISEGLADIKKVKLMSGSTDAFYQVLGMELGRTDADYADRLAKTLGVPESLRKGIMKGIKKSLTAPLESDATADVALKFGGFGNTLTTFCGDLKGEIERGVSSINVNASVGVTGIGTSGTGGADSGETDSMPGIKNPLVYNGRPKMHADGGRIDRQTLTWVGENNDREYVIPVSSKRRKRGINLWMQAGADLGVLNNADGGVYGSNAGGSPFRRMLAENGGTAAVINAESGSRGKTEKIEVNVGGVTIEIKGSGDGVSADVVNNKDAICSTIAAALQEAFQNLPLAAE